MKPAHVFMTPEQERIMIKNYGIAELRSMQDSREDSGPGTMNMVPVIKLFTPDAQCTWWLSEYDYENRLFFGLCDLGMGYPEMGYVSFDELTALRGPLGLQVEKDLHVRLEKTFSQLLEELGG